MNCCELDSKIRTSCIDLPSTFCVGDEHRKGISVFGADNLPKGLVGYWTFDDAAGADQSGNLVRSHELLDRNDVISISHFIH